MIGRWAEALHPVRRHLLSPLAGLLIEEGLDAAARRTITGLYGDYARGLPDAFAELEKAAAEAPPAPNVEERLAQSRRRANAAAALAALGRWDAARRLLVHALEPTARSYLIDRLGPGGAEAAGLVALIDADGDALGAPGRDPGARGVRRGPTPGRGARAIGPAARRPVP